MIYDCVFQKRQSLIKIRLGCSPSPAQLDQSVWTEESGRRHCRASQRAQCASDHPRRPRLVSYVDDPLTISSAELSTRGGFVVWRAAQWHPDLVTHVFSVCTPYLAPRENFISTEDLVKGPLPQFAYQLHLASGEVEKSVKDEESIRQFLKGMYGGKGPDGEVVFVPEKGVLPENLGKVGDSRLLNGEVSGDLLAFCRRWEGRGRSTMNAYSRRRSLMLGRASRCQMSLPARDAETVVQQVCCRIWRSLHERRERTQEIGFARHQHAFIYGSYRDRLHCVVSERASDIRQAMVC
jgi:hypothetical protein